ncbi:hypothetical protein WA158_002088 [Blastocystis sp. Blastoise]
MSLSWLLLQLYDIMSRFIDIERMPPKESQKLLLGNPYTYKIINKLFKTYTKSTQDLISFFKPFTPNILTYTFISRNDYLQIRQLRKTTFFTIFLVEYKKIYTTLLLPELSNDESLLCFFNFLYLHTLLNNKNIISLVGLTIFQSNYVSVLTNKCLEMSLEQYLHDSNDILSLNDKVSLCIKVLSLVQDLHNHHIIHRHLTPDEFYVYNGDIFLCLSAYSLQEGIGYADVNYINKLEYFQPQEYLNYNPPSIQGDIYTLGHLLHFILTGTTIINVKAVNIDMMKSLQNNSFIITISESMPLSLNKAISKCIQSNPDTRPTLKELTSAFTQFLELSKS